MPSGHSPAKDARFAEKQRRVLCFVRDYWTGHGYAPSIREIMQGCGLSSTSVTHYTVDALVETGWLRRDRGASGCLSRTIRPGLLMLEGRDA